MLTQIARIASTLGLLGGIAGAAAAAVAVLVFGIVEGDMLVGADGAWIYGVAALIGAAYGMVLAPVLVWFVCRNAPLWRAIGEPAIAGSLATALLFVLGYDVLVWTVPATASVLAAARLRWETERRLSARRPAA